MVLNAFEGFTTPVMLLMIQASGQLVHMEDRESVVSRIFASSQLVPAVFLQHQQHIEDLKMLKSSIIKPMLALLEGPKIGVPPHLPTQKTTQDRRGRGACVEVPKKTNTP